MGVLIYPCKLKERFCGTSDKDLLDDALRREYEQKDLIYIESPKPYNDYTHPFEEGYYTYETGEHDLSISYSTNTDLFESLWNLSEELDEYEPFDVTLRASGIDCKVSYEVAEEMLQELEKHKDAVEKYLTRNNDEYGEYLKYCFNTYVDIVRECVEIKGIICYR